MTDNNFQIYSAAVSDRGLSQKRPQNEDSFLEMKNLGLFAVADGVGGAQAGDVASQMAVEILGEAFVNLQASGDAEEMMKIAIERANSAIHQMSTDLPQLSTMATTVVALHIAGNIATIGHVGDSRLYRLDGRGSLYRETQDHSVVEEEVRAGRMTAAQAANHPSRNVISRALGAEGSVEVDMKTIMFDGNTKFLLCSDGITRHISDVELRELLMANASPSEICAKMKEICYSRGAEDNLTAVIVNIFRAAEENMQDLPTIVPNVADEEATVATARQGVSQTARIAPIAPIEPVDLDPDSNEIPTRSLEMPAAMQAPPTSQTFSPVKPFENAGYSNDDESYLMEEPGRQVSPPAPEPAEALNTAAFAASAAGAAPAAVPVERIETPKASAVYETQTKRDSDGIGKILLSLLWLLVGAILGVAGYYVWLTMTAKPSEAPRIPDAQYSNVAFGTFEESRRTVDANPNSVIARYEKTPPRDAADFYLLGRAQLLNKKYEDAKKSFIEARNKLGEYSESANKSVLTSDITIGLTISQDKAAQAAFEKELKFLSGGEQPVAESNSAANQ
ncbi:MAG TPA: PP2C family serine/threonine-protein phosphatase [Pyrinomonadaceae bacterium]|jgi:protein phosphatase